MSFKIIKGKEIQEWLDETINLTKTTLDGEQFPIDLKKLPIFLQERVEGLVVQNMDIGRTLLRQINKQSEVVYEYSWIANKAFPDILKKYLNFVLKSLSTLTTESENKPINIEERLDGTWAGTGWAFKGYIHKFEYKNQPPYSKEKEELLILEQYDLERQKFERLNRKYKSATVEEESYKRERISEEVRIAVWRRDDGKCARCGSRENLEYDHIVPVSKGGGNTARNIELLCESCNRKKSNKIE